MNDDDFNKLFDLEQSEFRKVDQSEPLFGFNAKPMLILFAVGIAASVVMTRLVYGEFPYWFLPLLESVGLTG
jgi:hypothetical protein